MLLIRQNRNGRRTLTTVSTIIALDTTRPIDLTILQLPPCDFAFPRIPYVTSSRDSTSPTAAVSVNPGTVDDICLWLRTHSCLHLLRMCPYCPH